MNIINAVTSLFIKSTNREMETTTCNNCNAFVTYDPKHKAKVECPYCHMPMFKTPK